MELQTTCPVRIGAAQRRTRVWLDGDALHLHAESTLTIRLRDITSLEAKRGVLWVRHLGGQVELELGADAARWLLKLQSPPTRAARLGVRAGQRVVVLGVRDEDLWKELEATGAELSSGKLLPESDLIVYAVERAADLERLASLLAYLKVDGALWVIRPKAEPEVSAAAVRRAARAAGLCEAEELSFSPSHAAERFVLQG